MDIYEIVNKFINGLDEAYPANEYSYTIPDIVNLLDYRYNILPNSYSESYHLAYNDGNRRRTITLESEGSCIIADKILILNRKNRVGVVVADIDKCKLKSNVLNL